MVKRMMWVMIVLMSIALIGISAIQYYWINSAIKTNEAKFKSDVFDVLNHVTAMLRGAELDAIRKVTRGSGANSTSIIDEIERENVKRMFNERSLAERIKVGQLEYFIKQGLADKNIDDDYKYGVYSLVAQSFVIENGHYTVPSFTTNIVHSNEDKGLFNSEYRVSIFNEGPSIDPGQLVIYFPHRSRFDNVSWIVIISLIFTLIILFVFIFTIYEINRQKKLSNMLQSCFGLH